MATPACTRTPYQSSEMNRLLLTLQLINLPLLRSASPSKTRRMQTRFDLTQTDIPKSWYNLLPDFPEPLPPPLHPGTRQPVPPEALLAIFPENLVKQEMSSEPWVEIPEPVREVYALWRPTPLLRA